MDPDRRGGSIGAKEVEDLRRRLRGAVRQACPPPLADQAEDIVQNALIALVRRLENSEGVRTFSSIYIWKAARGAVIDEIRRRARRLEGAGGFDGAEELLASGQPDPAAVVEARELGEAIRDCLGRLVRRRRLAVTLYLEGHGVPEIGRLLGWRAKDAENAVYRGLADLRRCLKEKGIRR